MLKFSDAQFGEWRHRSIDAFLRRVHDHQVRLGLVGEGAHFADRGAELAWAHRTAEAFGFKTEAYLMFVMDCLIRHGPDPVGTRLSRAYGTEAMRARALLDLE